MSDEPESGPLDTGPGITWHRLSPAMLLIHPVQNAVRTLTQVIGLSFVGRRIEFDHWPLAVLGLLASTGLVTWLTTRARVTPESIQLRSGVVVRNTLSTSRDRVRTVDITAPPMHRLLGVVRVVIGTGSNDVGNASLSLDGLSRPAAEALRDELLHRTAAQVDRPHSAQLLTAFDRSWMRYALVSPGGLVTGTGALAFLAEVLRQTDVDLEGWIDALAEANGAALVATAAIGANVAFFLLFGLLAYYLSYGNFRLTRFDAGTLQVRRGLLTNRTTSLELRRVVGAALSEPLLVRMVGGARAHAVSTGLVGLASGSSLLVPPAPRALVTAVADDVLRGPALTAPLLPHPRTALRRCLMRSLAPVVGLMVAGAVAIVLVDAALWWLALAPAVLAAAAWLGVDRYRSLGHAVGHGYVASRQGSATRERVALEAIAVIGWRVRSSWFQRRLGLLTLTATTPAGAQGYDIVDCDGEQALTVMTAVSPHLVEQFAT